MAITALCACVPVSATNSLPAGCCFAIAIDGIITLQQDTDEVNLLSFHQLFSSAIRLPVVVGVSCFYLSCSFLALFLSALVQVFLKSNRVARMVHSGGCSANDFRDVFKKNIEKRVRSLPEIDGLSKETVLSSWIAKYDAIYRGEEDLCKQPNRMALSAVSELILSKEQLYEMFQQILGIKKLEHQLIYNACQVSHSSQSRRMQRACLFPCPAQSLSVHKW